MVCEPIEIAVRHGKSGIFSSVADGTGCGGVVFGIGRDMGQAAPWGGIYPRPPPPTCTDSSRESTFAADRVALRVSRREDGILTQSVRMLRFLAV